MTAPNDPNDRIALAKGWKWVEFPSLIAPYHSVDGLTSFRSSVPTHWYNPKAEPAMRPDFVGTLEGVAGLMREMMEKGDFHPIWTPQMNGYMCADTSWSQGSCWFSDLEHPGHCVGEAWLSVFGKEAVDDL